jgi:hypothetical protein
MWRFIFGKPARRKVPDGAASSRPLLTLKGLKAKEIEMELTSVYEDETLQISAAKKWRTCFLQGRIEFGDYSRSGRPANSDLTQAIAEFIRERPFLSCKILCRHLRVSNETCLRFFTRNSGSKNFIFDGFHTSSPRTEHENLKSCHVTSTSCNTPALTNNGLCEFLDQVRVVVIFGVSPLWCLGRVQRWGTVNTQDKNRHWKVHDFDHLVHFWNPQSTCIDQTYEIQIQFSVLLSTCYSEYSANICSSSRRKPLNDIIFSCILTMPSSQFQTLFTKDWIRKAQKLPHPLYSLDPATSDLFLFGYLKRNSTGHCSLRATI